MSRGAPRKLTDRQVAYIRSLQAYGDVCLKELAHELGVSMTTVYHVRSEALRKSRPTKERP